MISVSPLTFGYLCLGYPDRLAIRLLSASIVQYCELKGLTLATIFADNGLVESVSIQPAFASLLTALDIHNGSRVVIPAINYLSIDIKTQQTLRAQVAERNASLLVMHS
jgi:hypothetical protein